MRGFNREAILKFSNECLAPTATITLLVGAGGGFGRILQDSGVSQAIVEVALHAHVPLLISGVDGCGAYPPVHRIGYRGHDHGGGHRGSHCAAYSGRSA